MGFECTSAGRAYRLRVDGVGEPRLFTVTILTAAFDTRKARFQDAPELCFARLQRELATNAELADGLAVRRSPPPRSTSTATRSCAARPTARRARCAPGPDRALLLVRPRPAAPARHPRARLHAPDPHPGAVDPARDGGPRRPRLRRHRQRQDGGVRPADPAPPDGQAAAHHAGAHPHPDPRARRPDRRAPRGAGRAHAGHRAPPSSAASAWGRRSTPCARGST